MDDKLWEELINISYQEINNELMEDLSDEDIEKIFDKYAVKYEQALKELS